MFAEWSVVINARKHMHVKSSPDQGSGMCVSRPFKFSRITEPRASVNQVQLGAKLLSPCAWHRTIAMPWNRRQLVTLKSPKAPHGCPCTAWLATQATWHHPSGRRRTNEQLEGLEGKQHGIQDEELAIGARTLPAHNIHGSILPERNARVHAPSLIPTP